MSVIQKENGSLRGEALACDTISLRYRHAALLLTNLDMPIVATPQDIILVTRKKQTDMPHDSSFPLPNMHWQNKRTGRTLLVSLPSWG
ncbi:hypothetical protein Cocul_00151 [Corynebacterium oculi]|uniref:Uncharacterized protein n=1 Tax=Corynebacterium oculi TaxID=1544416 RepID=A0A0N8VZW3_9CORY|nr:hypothetical protein Cocul_00151 [Corynebacterium oculi]